MGAVGNRFVVLCFCGFFYFFYFGIGFLGGLLLDFLFFNGEDLLFGFFDWGGYFDLFSFFDRGGFLGFIRFHRFRFLDGFNGLFFGKIGFLLSLRCLHL